LTAALHCVYCLLASRYWAKCNVVCSNRCVHCIVTTSLGVHAPKFGWRSNGVALCVVWSWFARPSASPYLTDFWRKSTVIGILPSLSMNGRASPSPFWDRASLRRLSCHCVVLVRRGNIKYTILSSILFLLFYLYRSSCLDGHGSLYLFGTVNYKCDSMVLLM
jgi:hypothetical protein